MMYVARDAELTMMLAYHNDCLALEIMKYIALYSEMDYYRCCHTGDDKSPPSSQIVRSAWYVVWIVVAAVAVIMIAVWSNPILASPTPTSPTPTPTSPTPTPTSPSTQPAQLQGPEPTIAESFTWQRMVSSKIDPLSGRNLAVVLLPRSDGAVYSGVITYTASRDVNVEIWHNFKKRTPEPIGNTSIAQYGSHAIAISDILSSGSGSIPFSGNAVLLNSQSPFKVSYTVNAVARPSNNTAPSQQPKDHSFVNQRVLSSTSYTLSGHSNEQAAVILGTRTDGAVYSGVVTYVSTAPVDVQVWRAVGGAHFIPSTINSPTKSDSIKYSGSALVIHSSGHKFKVSYTVNAVARPSNNTAPSQHPKDQNFSMP
jgi:hypothetical protein